MTNNPTPPDLTPAELRELASNVRFSVEDGGGSTIRHALLELANLKERAGSVVTAELTEEVVNCAWRVAGTTMHSKEDVRAALKAVWPCASVTVAEKTLSPAEDVELLMARSVCNTAVLPDLVAAREAVVIEHPCDRSLYITPQQPPAVDRYACLVKAMEEAHGKRSYNFNSILARAAEIEKEQGHG